MDVTAVSQKPALALDPRTKFIVLFVVGFIAFSGLQPAVELAVFAVLCSFLLSYRQTGFVVKIGVVYLAMFALDFFVAPLLGGWGGALFLACVKRPRLVLLILRAANLLIKTTSVSEFNAAFHKMHVSDRVIIPFSVMFRFIPTIQEEWRSIQNAMKLRGVASSFGTVAKAPMQALEYSMVPLLMSVATISDELAAASLSRGLETGGARTCLTQVRFGIADCVAVALCLALVVYQVVF